MKANALCRSVLAIWMLLLGLFSPRGHTHPFQEMKTLKTPKGIPVLFLEMPQTAQISLAIGFKHGGLQHFHMSRLLARSLQKGIDSQHVKVPYKKLSIGADFVFDCECFNVYLESEAAQLEAALQCVVHGLQFKGIGEKEFSAARRELIQEEQRAQRRELSRIEREVEEQAPHFMVRRKMEPLRDFANRQMERQLGIYQSDIAAMKRLTWPLLKDFATHYFTRDQLMIGVVGAIQPEVLLAAIDRTLGQLPKRSDVQIRLPTAQIKPSPLPKKQFFLQKDTRIPTIICFGQPFNVSLLDRAARIPLLSLIRDMIQFYAEEVQGEPVDDLDDFLQIGALSISVKEEGESLSHLRAYFAITSKNAAQRVVAIEQCLKEFKEKGIHASWFPRYLAQLQTKDKLAKWREEWIAEIEPDDLEEYKRRPNYAAYYLLNRQAQVLAKFPPNPAAHIDYLKKVQIEDLLPLLQTLLNPDQLVFTAVGTENPFK